MFDTRCMRIFITGATGFLGRYVVRASVDAGHECICLYRSSVPVDLNQSDRIKWVQGGLRSDWSSDFHTVDVILHLAAVGVSPQQASREESFQVNVIDSLLLVEHAVKAGVRRVIACGSCFEYGASGERYEHIPVDAPLEPLNAYGASKAAATVALCALAREQEFSLTILRPFHFYGEGQASINLWPSLKRAALAGDDFEMTFGGQIRDYMSVEDVAAAFLTELNSPLNVNPIVKNVGSGVSVSLKSFCEYWWKHWSANGVLKVGSIPYRSGEVMRYVPEISKS